MAELTAIRVLIKLTPAANGAKHLYPNFNRIPSSARQSMDWSAFIDLFGTGWHYDQVAPFGATDPESPNSNEMFGIIAIPEDFAQEAVALFPDEVSTLTDAEFSDLFDNRTKTTSPDEVIDTDRLNELRAKYGINGAIDSPAAMAMMSAEDRRAVDPNDPAPGIVTNPNKNTSRFLMSKGHTIKPIPAFSSNPRKAPNLGG